MTTNIITFDDFKQQVLNTKEWTIALDADDLTTFNEKDGETVAIEAITNDTTSERMHKLSRALADKLPLMKLFNYELVMLCIHVSRTTPLKAEELEYVHTLIETIEAGTISCEIKWGLAVTDCSDEIRITMALKLNELKPGDLVYITNGALQGVSGRFVSIEEGKIGICTDFPDTDVTAKLKVPFHDLRP